jgi:hypothetical protein
LSSKIAVNRERVARENNNRMMTDELKFIWIIKKVNVEEPRAVDEIIRGYTNLEIVSLSFLIAIAANMIDMRAVDMRIYWGHRFSIPWGFEPKTQRGTMRTV